MNEEAKKLIIEYRNCDIRLKELDHTMNVTKEEYKERIKDSFNQDGIIDFDKQIKCIASEEYLRDCLYRYKMAIQELLINKFNVEVYYDKVAIPDESLDIKNTKPDTCNKYDDKKIFIPENIRNEIIKLVRSVVNEMNKAKAEAFKDKNN